MGSTVAVPTAIPAMAAIAGVAYTSWVLEFALNPALDPVNGYASELSASDQPFHYVFAGGDLLTGLLTIGVAGFMLRRASFAPAGWVALLLFGAFSICDSLFAMDCAPNSDTGCALRERAGRVSFSHEFHSVTSVCVIGAGILCLAALTLAARRDGRWPVIARWGWLLLGVETATALATLPMMYFGVWLGIMERVQTTTLSLWLLVIAGELYADRWRARRASVPATAREKTSA